MKIEIELDNLMAEEQQTIKQLAERKKKPYWVPNEKENFFCINAIGEILLEKYPDIPSEARIPLIKIGNCFRTEDEAKEAVTKLKMQIKWKQLSLEAGEAENPWDGNRPHFFAYWDCVNKKIGYCYHNRFKGETISFPCVKNLKTAIDQLG